jgi:phosphatidylethanolamine-binding protein (PEBP) family uncharacterized protein
MATTLRSVIEVTLSWLLLNYRGRDAKSFYTRPAFKNFESQSIKVTSPDCGASGSKLDENYTQDGNGKHPALQWSAPSEILNKVKEWLLVSEDPDAPLPTPVVHGYVLLLSLLYLLDERKRKHGFKPVCNACVHTYLTSRWEIKNSIFTAIPPSKTSVVADDFEIVDQAKALMKGGFHYGRSRNGMPYIPPRPLMNHGPHRYFFIIVALNKPLDSELLTAETTREQVAEAIEGKVLGWGMWVGVAERIWK